MDTDPMHELDALADTRSRAELLDENRRLHDLLDRKWDAGRSKRPCAGCGAIEPAFALRDDTCLDCWYRRAKGLESAQ